jgi:lipopolysaccharide/colanic/teichoic acid biosynthesis glycosyltransferase
MRSHRIDTVAAPQVMDHLVRRECARADRNGEVFSLVLFRVPEKGRRRTFATHRLIRTMQKRARLTDDVGWVGQSHLGALLTDTSPAGAQAFADVVGEIIARHGPRPLAMVYSYPSDRAAIASAQEVGVERVLAQTGTHAVGAPMRISGNGRSQVPANSIGGGSEPHRASIAGRINASPQPALPAVKVRPDRLATPVEGIEDLLTLPMPRWKRALDLIFSLVLLVLLWPILAMAALAIKLTSPGPVLYKQRRSGLGGRPFVIWKFRTMVVDAEKRQQELRKFNEQDGPAFKLTRDPRVTRIGALLRKTSIDELPQLWNVIKGEMSLVGPRPLPVAEQEGCEQWQRHRLNVTPGLTCIWQVKGRSTVSFADWVRMDVEYIRRRTILHDLGILFSTIPSVLLRKGAR